MIAGIGTDLLKIERLKILLSSGQEAVLERVYSTKEQEQALSRPNPLEYYAARFACKEAIFKCLNLDGNSAKLNEIEVLSTESGVPTVTLYGDILRASQAKDIVNINVSLSYEDEYVLAFAIAQTK